MTKLATALWGVAVIGVVAGGCRNRFLRKQQEQWSLGPAPGRAAPAYAAPTLDGDTLSLADLRGHVVMLNVWGTWCVPCVQELPALTRLQRRYAGRGLRVVGVNTDEVPSAQVKSFLRAHDVGWTNLHDGETRVDSAFGWGIGLPKTVLIDRAGVVRAWWWGPPGRAALDSIRAVVETGTPPVDRSPALGRSPAGTGANRP